MMAIEAGQLGPEISVHRVRSMRLLVPAAVGGVMLVGLVWNLAAGTISQTAFALLFGATWTILMADLLPAMTRLVAIHRDGLRISAFGAEWSFRWADVVGLRLDPKVRLLPLPGDAPLYLGVAVTAGESQARFDDDLDDFALVLGRIVEALQQNVGDGAERRFEHGESIWFGPLEAASEGLRLGDRLRLWGSVSEVGLSWGHLTIDGEPLCPARQVDNLPVLLRLLRRREVRVDELEKMLRLERSGG